MINLKEHKKHSRYLAVLLASVLLSSLFVGVALGFLSNQSTYGPKYADYIVMEGVAGNDYYDTRQYSYQVNQWANETVCSTYGTNTGNPNPANNWFKATKSLRVGFTEFGEFATLNNTGVAYGANTVEFGNTESWASTHIPSKYWIQGWLFYMNYTRGGSGGMRQIEAYAVYSDTINTEAGRGVYSWVGNDVSYESGYTVGNLTASGVEVLYDSARLVVARATVLIQDGAYGFEDVAKITFTVIYNKDTKYAIVYKDIKILLDTKILQTINDFVFQEKYEIDLARGVNQGNTAYIHWFHNYNASVYMHPLTGQNMTDVVQAFDPAKKYIFFAGYWPNCTEYSVFYDLVPVIPVQGFTAILPRGTAQADNPGVEPNTPWVTAQWRYNSTNWPKMLNFLAKGTSAVEGVPLREIRFVEVFGMTDYNKGNTYYNSGAIPYNARDIQAGDQFNSLDIEVRYMLYGKVFVPEDLTDINDQPFQWIGMGQSAATTDSAGAATLSDLNQAILQEPLPLFDRNDTAFPWTAPTIPNKGTIPYGLCNGTVATGTFVNYLETFNNVAKMNGGVPTGTDPKPYIRTGLVNFAFNVYDDVLKSPPQPVAGGYSASNTYWYPSKDPLTERWNGAFTSMVGYGGILYHPNGIVTLGGEKANGLTRYFNDFDFAISREGTTPYALVNDNFAAGSAPTSNPGFNTLDYFPLSTWNSNWASPPSYKNPSDNSVGYAVIALARDINGTRGMSVYGWDARDTYWAAAWTSQYLGVYVNSQWVPAGTVALVLKISYNGPNLEPTAFTVVKALGTITEFGSNIFVTNYGGFDAITGPATWNGNVVPPTLPSSLGYNYKVWWYAKLPTTSEAKVDYDP
jgi:hypothetical protein